MYAKTQNNKVKTYRTLQRVYNGILNFNNASQETIQENGFYQVVVPDVNEDTEILLDIEVSDFDADAKVFNQRKRDLTADELQAKADKQKLDRYIEIDRMVKTLSYGAIGIILGITGLTDEEMQARMNLYKILYDACKETNPDASTLQIIEVKRNLYNLKEGVSLDMSEYKALVIQKWEAGEKAFDGFNLMIEAVRSKWKLVVTDDTKYNQIKTIIEGIGGDTTPGEVPILFNQIMAV